MELPIEMWSNHLAGMLTPVLLWRLKLVNKLWNSSIIYSIMTKAKSVDVSFLPKTKPYLSLSIVKDIFRHILHSHGELQSLRLPMQAISVSSLHGDEEEAEAHHSRVPPGVRIEKEQAMAGEAELVHDWDFVVLQIFEAYTPLMSGLRQLDIGYGIGAEQLRVIAMTCTNLTELSMPNATRPLHCRLYFPNLTKLRSLNLSSTNFWKDDGLPVDDNKNVFEPLAFLTRLTTLDISHSEIYSNQFTGLTLLTSLRHLNAAYCSIEDQFLENLTWLKSLIIRSHTSGEFYWQSAIVSCALLTKLEYLAITQHYSLPPQYEIQSVGNLNKLANLRVLDLLGFGTSEGEWASLLKGTTSLEILRTISYSGNESLPNLQRQYRPGMKLVFPKSEELEKEKNKPKPPPLVDEFQITYLPEHYCSPETQESGPL